jgi:hypothetical protein
MTTGCHPSCVRNRTVKTQTARYLGVTKDYAPPLECDKVAADRIRINVQDAGEIADSGWPLVVRDVVADRDEDFELPGGERPAEGGGARG